MKVTTKQLGINARCSTCGNAADVEIKPDPDTGLPVWWVHSCETCGDKQDEEFDELKTELSELRSQIEDFDYDY